jgi:hypothetical protein
VNSEVTTASVVLNRSCDCVTHFHLDREISAGPRAGRVQRTPQSGSQSGSRYGRRGKPEFAFTPIRKKVSRAELVSCSKVAQAAEKAKCKT